MIDDKTFNYAPLIEVVLPSSLRSIGDSAFAGNDYTKIALPDGLEKIASYGFSGNHNLEELIIPNTVRDIGVAAFAMNSKLRSIIFPSGISRLRGAFLFNCPELQIVAIPKSVTSIDATNMFDGSYLVNIWGFKGSEAEKFAKKNNIPFVVVDPVQEVRILLSNKDITKSKIFIDLNTDINTLKLSSQTSPNNPWPGVIWKSSNAKTVSIDTYGIVTGLKKGKATITATAADGSGKKATCEVTVAKLVKEIRITGDGTIQAGKKTALQAVILPDTADTKKLDWITSDKNIATVDAKGVVSAKKLTEEQPVKITATANDGSGTFAEFVITVVPFAEPLDLNAINNTNTTGSDSRFVGKLYRVTGIIYQAMGPSDGGNALILIEPNVMAKGMGSTLPLEINIWLTPDEFEKIGGISSEGKQVDISVKLTSISRNTLSKDAAVKGYPIQLEFGEYD